MQLLGWSCEPITKNVRKKFCNDDGSSFIFMLAIVRDAVLVTELIKWYFVQKRFSDINKRNPEKQRNIFIHSIVAI